MIDLKNIPQKPGVYLWLDSADNILYIGKAKNLKRRMTQYFKGSINSYKTASLVKQIVGFKYIITNSDQEALILERNLIEKHFPPYNIKLTDDKRYPYIKIKLAKKLEVSLVYRMSNRRERALYFGPFPAGYGARKLTNLIQRMTTYEKGLPSKETSRIYWEKKYDYAKKLLSPKNGFLIKELKEKIRDAVSNQQYEIAKDIKDTLTALSYNSNDQVVEFSTLGDIDVVAFVEKDGFLSVNMLFYRMGMLLSQKSNIVEITESKEESVRQYMSQYYNKNVKPNLIISNIKVDSDLNIFVPQKGAKKRILNIAITNASDNIDLKLSKYIRKTEQTIGSLRKLEKLIGVDSIHRLIMIDNSNTNNINPVSGIVSYVNGLKKKQEYRKFNLVQRDKKADVDYMEQALERFVKNIPYKIDLLIVDGGIQQVNIAKKIVSGRFPIIGLVKDDKHNTREIVDSSGKFIPIDDNLLKNFLSEIQIEVDRFAKQHHRRIRSKKSLESSLIQIPGIGESTERKLLNHFKNFVNIYNAPIEELEKVVSKDNAKKIKEALNEGITNIR